MQGLDWLKQGLWSVLLCIAAGLFFLGGAEAAVTWEKGYKDVSYPQDIEPTADGSYASFGYFYDRVNDKFSSGVLKLDALGNVEWYRKYNLANAGDLQASALKSTRDGGFILCGQRRETTSSAWVMKLDGAGNVLWTKTYKLAVPPTYNYPYRNNAGIQILEADDGGYIFLATDLINNTMVTKERNIWLMKLSQGGDIQWQKTLSASAADIPKNLLKSKNGDYIVTGSTNYVPLATRDSLAVKFDAAGEIKWAKTYSGAGDDIVQSVVELADGNIALAGTSQHQGPSSETPWLVKLDVGGNILWQREYGMKEIRYPVTILPTADSGFLLASSETGQYHPFLLKIDSVGTAQWSTSFGYGVIRDFQPSADGGYVVARPYLSLLYVSKLDANAESCLLRSKSYLTTTIENNFSAVDASLRIVQTDAVPVSVAVVVEDLSPAPPQLFCISALPEIAVDASALDYGFGSVEVLSSAAANVFVSNICGADLNVSAMTITGANAADFSVTTDCSTIVAGGSCSAEVVFAPGSLGNKLALLTILSNDPMQPKIEIPLSGQGVDTESPVITLIGQKELNLEVGSAYADAGATALDNYDGNLTAAIVTDNSVNPAVVGTYSVTYDVTDSSGNQATSVVRTVHVVDTKPPIITLSGQDELTVEAGSVYVDAGATALDKYDGNLTSAIVTSNPVNSSVVGTYLVTYDVADASGNRATRLVRTVHVVDTIAPEVSLSVDQALLWPPNHKLIDILVNGGAQDSGSGLLSVVLSVTDEYGKYNLTLPAFGRTVALEAWRDGQDKNGRVYTLTAVATDRAGNVTTRSTNILVPHDMEK